MIHMILLGFLIRSKDSEIANSIYYREENLIQDRNLMNVHTKTRKKHIF